MATLNKITEMAESEVKKDCEVIDLEDAMGALITSENYIIVDIGANLTNKKFTRDLDSVVSRARDAGVRKIMVTGITVQSSKDALRLTRLFPETLYSTAGVHPHEAKSWDDETEEALRELAANHEVVAIGECGLDFNRNFSPQDVQLEVFEKQVSLACELRKPLFVHERDAHKEVLEVLGKYKGRLPAVVIHCFTGDATQATAYLKEGCYIGLTGYVWKDKSEDGVRRILEDGVVPLDRLLVETDSPFMYPNTRASKLPPYVKETLTERSLTFLHRYCTFQRNEPCSLPVTIEMIAAYMKKKSEQVALQTTFNALKVFGLST
ncbi:3'-5' ssDNA/RNA exonuclease TatD-like [Homarus americanus]|uniref:Deoxyribonuclease TATDN1 n=1 Tax=Homarus americanus TaxID=6706 RepID=A0A8J5JSP6_HOMAM|nr:3'-5' ssDNA/RNA exonuclease TatD-like [Homarus americanus]